MLAKMSESRDIVLDKGGISTEFLFNMAEEYDDRKKMQLKLSLSFQKSRLELQSCDM